MSQPEISVVVPLYQEEENVPPLIAAVDEALATLDYELILVDDGSADTTFARVEEACIRNPRIRAIQFMRNFGQTAAISAGFAAARGRYIAYMDGDLQTDPADILLLLETLKSRQLDLVNGWRKARQDDTLTRVLPSRIANALIRHNLGIRLHDYGCPLKVMRAAVAKQMNLYGEQHRMMVAIAAIQGARIGEQIVQHRPRRFGSSKYNLSRTWRVIIDLLLIMFFQRFTDRPLQFFGSAGLLATAGGLTIDGWLTIQKIFFDMHLADRPLLQLGSLLIVSGILLFGIGIILEMQMRMYYESTGRHHYTIRRMLPRDAPLPEAHE